MERSNIEEPNHTVEVETREIDSLKSKLKMPAIEAIEEIIELASSQEEVVEYIHHNPSIVSQYKPPEEKPLKTRKPRAKYTVTPAVLERNKKNGAAHRKRRAEEKKKLEEYEKLLQFKGVSREDVEGVLNEKLTALEQKLDVRLCGIPRVVPPLQTIIESPHESQAYTSDSERRFSDRFKRNGPASPIGYTRFSRV